MNLTSNYTYHAPFGYFDDEKNLVLSNTIEYNLNTNKGLSNIVIYPDNTNFYVDYTEFYVYEPNKKIEEGYVLEESIKDEFIIPENLIQLKVKGIIFKHTIEYIEQKLRFISKEQQQKRDLLYNLNIYNLQHLIVNQLPINNFVHHGNIAHSQL